MHVDLVDRFPSLGRFVDPGAPAPRIAILGAGAGGMAMGIRLLRLGIDSFTIYEKSDGVGGTWRDNTYPGAACDVPSHLYSFSFAPKADWTRVFPEQPEILAYFEECADRYGLRARLRTNTEVTEARWDDASCTWHLRTAQGESVEADIVVSGLGQLNLPALPDIEGRAQFGGAAFHSARWDHTVDLRDKRIAVIGNGASAVQFVPRIAPDAAQLTVFQRSASWLVPRPDGPYPDKAREFFGRHDLARRAHRAQIFGLLELRWWALREGSRRARSMAQAARDQLAEQIEDPVLRARLTPDYPIGCKRILISSDYYPALARDNVDLVTDRIARMTPTGIVTDDGTERDLDVVIYGTGFRSTEFLAPIEVVGRDGRRLHEEWAKGAEAYLGVATNGFPNLFMLYGPNTNLGHNSIIFMIEAQVGYILRAIATMRREHAAAFEVRADAVAEYERRVHDDIAKTVWEGGCTSWYKTESGKVTNNWPRPASAYWWLMQRSGFAAFDRLAARVASSSPTGPSAGN